MTANELVAKHRAVYRYTRNYGSPCLATQHFAESGITDVAAMDSVYADLAEWGLLKPSESALVKLIDSRTGDDIGRRSMWVICT